MRFTFNFYADQNLARPLLHGDTIDEFLDFWMVNRYLPRLFLQIAQDFVTIIYDYLLEYCSCHI